MSWFQCAGCDRIVTGLVRGTGPKNSEYYSSTHCCLRCQAGEEHDADWCAGLPGKFFREIKIPGSDLPAHYLAHVPDGACSLPAVLFLHGGVTYVYPESLWWDFRELVKNNSVVRERFIVIAPIAAVGEPIAVVSTTRKKVDRFGNSVDYADDFHEDLVWETFVQACKALDSCVDWSRLSVLGYSMGGQSAWNLMLRQGPKLAAAVPFAGCCQWVDFDWNTESSVLKNLEGLAIRSYNGEQDTGTYSWWDFVWLAKRFGLASQPQEKMESHVDNVTVKSYEWSDSLQLFLVNGTPSCHCCWDVVLHNEESFKLFTWLETRRRALRKRGPEEVCLDATPEASESLPDESAGGLKEARTSG